MAQRGRQDRPHSQPLAGRHIHVGIVLRVMAEHDLAGADAIGGNPGIGLETDAQVRRIAPGACPAHHFVALAQRDGGAARARQGLRPLGDQADGGLQINFRRI